MSSWLFLHDDSGNPRDTLKREFGIADVDALDVIPAATCGYVVQPHDDREDQRRATNRDRQARYRAKQEALRNAENSVTSRSQNGTASGSVTGKAKAFPRNDPTLRAVGGNALEDAIRNARHDVTPSRNAEAFDDYADPTTHAPTGDEKTIGKAAIANQRAAWVTAGLDPDIHKSWRYRRKG